MKHLKSIIALLVTCALLTGCSTADANNALNNSGNYESDPGNTSNDDPANSTPDPENPPQETENTAIKLKLSPELEQIVDPLSELGKFYRSYCFSEINQQAFVKDGKIAKGDITTYAQLTDALHSFLTEKCIEETSPFILDMFSQNDDGLHLRSIGAGGFLGYNYLYLRSVEQPDENTILLNMFAEGETENFDTEFQITLKKDGEKFLVDKADRNACEFLAAFGFVIYNNVCIGLDNTSETLLEYWWATDHLSVTREFLNETEQILRLLKGYGKFVFAMQPQNNLDEIVDRSQEISVDGINMYGEPYTSVYYKVVNGVACTEAQLDEKLDGLVTENLKKQFKERLQNLYRIQNGDLYLHKDGAAYGMGLGMDRLYLNSIEYPDENTILVNITSFGDKNKWDAEKDIEDKYTIKIIRTDDGLRISECGIDCEASLFYYNEVIYGDTTFSL